MSCPCNWKESSCHRHGYACIENFTYREGSPAKLVQVKRRRL